MTWYQSHIPEEPATAPLVLGNSLALQASLAHAAASFRYFLGAIYVVDCFLTVSFLTEYTT